MIRLAGAMLVAWTLHAAPVVTQQLGPSTGGIGALDQALRFLGQNKRVLMIAAHPDDEDTELLTVLVRGHGAEAAYLSLTRGEGGQNLIGNELGPGLGVVRTEELLAARGLDGARQYFTRAYDFGYSKGLQDTWRFWPQDSVLKDVVRIIRRFQPQIIVSVFSGTPRDGHGHHQAAGWAAHEGFRLAGDGDVFPELEREEGLGPWTPLKLFRGARFDPGEATHELDGGVLDPAVGQSFRQIAMRGRSLHRSQDMGAPQPIGPSVVRLRLVDDRTGQDGGTVFGGVDTSLAGTLGRQPTPAERAETDAIAAALATLSPWNTAQLSGLRTRYAALVAAGSETPASRDQVARMMEAEFLASRVLCDAVTGTEWVVPGARIPVTLSCWNASADTVEGSSALMVAGRPVGDGRAWRLAPGRIQIDSFIVAMPDDAPLTVPYYLREARAGAFHVWPPATGGVEPGEPYEAPWLKAVFRVGTVEYRREVVHRTVDQAIGEVRRPVVVVPRIAVALTPGGGVWPVGDTTARVFAVTLTHGARQPINGRVRLEVPAGWTVGQPQPFRLAGERTTSVHRFVVRAPPSAGPTAAVLRAVARDASGAEFSLGTLTVEYPHIRPRQLVVEGMAEVRLAPIALPAATTVAYVRGAADGIPEVLAAIGLDVVLLSADSLAAGNLDRFRTIVIGPRAWETEPALATHASRLSTFAERGGTVIVQYQQHAYFNGGSAPYPLRLTADGATGPGFRVQAPRVAEEDADVRILESGHRLFHEPNRLTAEDWQGWVQERGLYFARTWSDDWTPLLEMGDTGEDPLRGGLLVSRVGRGWYVYTGISFFRQLPAAVPGAVRLFLNLLAVGEGDAP